MSDIETKVKAMLRQAEDRGVTDAEALNLTSMAARLCMIHNLNLLTMKNQAFDIQKKETAGYEDLLAFNPFSVGKSNLLAGIAAGFGGVAIIERSAAHNQAQNAAIIRVFAFPADMDQIKLIFDSTLVQGENGRNRRVAKGFTSRGDGTSYWLGYASGVKEKLQKDSEETIAEIEQSNPGTSLVVIERNKLVRREMNRVYPRLRTVRRTYSSSSGYNAGKEDGRNAMIDNSRSIGGRKAIGS